MEIKGKEYYVIYNPDTARVTFQGTLRSCGASEYVPIVQLLDDVVASTPRLTVLDLRELYFVNSSGINVIFRFIIKICEQKSNQLVARGARQVPWQNKLLENLQRLMPELQLVMD